MPRSKAPKISWIKCLNCGLTFSSRDERNHAQICKSDKPFDPENIAQSRDLSYGFLSDDILVGVAVINNVLPKYCTSTPSIPVCFLHPSALQKLGACNGQNVIINHRHMVTAWVNKELPQTAVSMTAAVAQWAGIEAKKPVIVYCSDTPVFKASHIGLDNIGQQHDFMNSGDFPKTILSKLQKRIFSCGNAVDIKYFGQPCKMSVIKTVNERGDTDEADDALVQSLKQLSLKPNKKKPENHCPINIFRQKQLFLEVTRSTRISIASETNKQNDSNKQAVSIKQVGGLEAQIKLLHEMINFAMSDSKASVFGSLPSARGALVHGPSGCGKTLLINAVAQDSGYFVVNIETSKIWTRYYGESEANLVAQFKVARQRSPSIVILDDIDALCPRREKTNNEVEKRVVNTLLSLIDDMVESGERVFILAASSKPDSVDSALRRPGRLDTDIDVGVPNAKQRLQILEKLLSGMRSSAGAEDVADVASNAHGFTGADLRRLCSEAAVQALRRHPNSAGSSVVIMSSDLRHGLHAVQPSAMKEVAIEVPKVLWTDIGGQHELKEKLKQAVEWPLKSPETFERMGIQPPRGLLMYGPPGCSKTMIAKALARESGLNFLAIKGPELFSQWVGESERAVREVFRKARAAAPAIVFFDEIDALAGERGSGSGGGGDVSDRVLAQLLTEIDGVDALRDVTIVAATNRPDRIDQALLRPGRLDRKVYVPLPDAATRGEIFRIRFQLTPVAADVSIEELVEKTEKYSGAEVSSVVLEAAIEALKEDMSIAAVHNRHFQYALKHVQPRIPDSAIQFYERFAKTGSGSGLADI